MPKQAIALSVANVFGMTVKNYMKMTGSEALIESFLQQGVKTIFGYPGGAIMPVYDALYKYKDKIRHVLVRHEQGAAHAAEGFAYITGRPGVCIATSGPGATNLVTGIMDAMMDSVPLVCITGQVSSTVVGTDAFQEADVIGITTPITKWNYQVTKAAEIPEVVAKAFQIAGSGRPGPVVIDITKDAQFEVFEYVPSKKVEILGYQPTYTPNQRQIKLAADLINSAKRPYMFIGHGILIAKAEEEVRKVAETAGMPVASTLLGLSAFPTDHELYAGMLGMHGNYAPNVLSRQADVVIAVGMRFDDRVTGRLKDFIPQAKVIHIDIDPAELNKNIKAEIPIVADAKQALVAMIPLLEKKEHKEWVAEFKKYDKMEFEKVIEQALHPKSGEIKMSEAISEVHAFTKGEAVVVADVGQHQMMAARYYKCKKTHSFITSGGAGTMGFALPASMGACVATPDRPVVAFIGDGSFQMTIQELGTVAQEQFPVKIIILNNRYLGMVRQWQELFFEHRYSFVNMQNPDFVQVAKGYHIEGERVEKREDLQAAIERTFAHKGPYLLEIMVEQEQNVFPMVPTGASADEIRLE